jgi:hypothetical protein
MLETLKSLFVTKTVFTSVIKNNTLLLYHCKSLRQIIKLFTSAANLYESKSSLDSKLYSYKTEKNLLTFS